MLSTEQIKKKMATQEIELPNVPETKPKEQPQEQIQEQTQEQEVTSSPVIEINCTANTENGEEPTETDSQKHTNVDSTEANDHIKNGVTNPVFMQEDAAIEETIPPITYVDFLPTKSQEEFQTDPVYTNFR